MNLTSCARWGVVWGANLADYELHAEVNLLDTRFELFEKLVELVTGWPPSRTAIGHHLTAGHQPYLMYIPCKILILNFLTNQFSNCTVHQSNPW